MGITEFAVYGSIGVVAGIVGGLLGISGGVIVVPSLLMFFQRQLGYSLEEAMRIAVGTSLASMVFNALSSTLFHNRRLSILWSLVRPMVPGLILGSCLGAWLAHLLPGAFLKNLFSSFTCGLGVYYLLRPKPGPSEKGSMKPPPPLLLGLMGSGVALFSNLLGIGGGILTVPLFMALRVSTTKSIGTGAAVGLCITTLGALCYFFLGLNNPSPSGTLGAINMPAFVIIGVISFVLAPLGVKWAHMLPAPLLRRLFGCALIAVGLSLA